MTFIKTQGGKVRKIFGIIVILTALFIQTGMDRRFQSWILDNLPESWTQIATTVEEKFDVGSQVDSLRSQTLKRKENLPEGDIVINKNIRITSDFEGAKVNKSDLLQGCYGQDCIPSIDNPKFEKASEADWMNGEDIVFAVNYKGETRAYPQRILNWHEIVNDNIAGDAVMVTFCPLCGSALGFVRKVNGKITEFGVSGKLHNSDLVMYDRFEGNLWQQVTGEAIVGPAARRDEVLDQIPVVTTVWKDWIKEHPSSLVLSRDTGFSRDYQAYPYGTYEQDDELYFGVKNLDKKLQIKTVVYGVEIDEFAKAYPKSVFSETPIITDTIGNTEIRIERLDSGEISVTNLQTNEKIIPIRLFWFAWASFHPNTELYLGN